MVSASSDREGEQVALDEQAARAPIGTQDIWGEASRQVEAVVSTFAKHVELAGYGLLLGPMFEDARVFTRAMGHASEVVVKEMYTFEDHGGRLLALRPEATASVARAFVQHRPPSPWKVWYATPAFRYERPQAGRYRQHHQLGVEVLGSADPDLDVEVIALAERFVAALGLAGVSLRVGSLGDPACRPAYVEALRSYLASRAEACCAEHRGRISVNPLRVLDCKTQECRSVTADAPRLQEALCADCRNHQDRVLAGLDALGIACKLDDSLVRGLDYYTRTTFELSADALASAQNGLGGGGRYDGLVEALGGPPTPGIGFAMGIERLMLARLRPGAAGPPSDVGTSTPVFVVDMVGGSAARDLTDELRRAGIGADRAFGQRSLKAQLKAADRSGAYYACIVGPDEQARGSVAIRSLRDVMPGGERQLDVGRDVVVAELMGLIAATGATRAPL